MIDADAEHKRWATLVARTALAGHVLDRRISDTGADVFVARRWGWSREFHDLAAVEFWLRSVTGEVAA